MSRRATIVERALAGETILPATVDDEIDLWHDSATTQSLAEWLGMTEEEYRLFAEQPGALEIILEARRRGVGLRDFLRNGRVSGGVPERELERVRSWLRTTGRL